MSAASHPAADAKDLPTACVLCSHNCGLRVDVEDGRIAAVRADPKNPFTRGYSCNKAYSIARYVHHAQRVTRPLRRRPDGSFEQITWTEALREIGERLARIRNEHSPRAIALAGVGGQGNHMDGPFATGFMKAVGSPWIFNALAQEKTQHPLVDSWMMNAPPTRFLHGDVERSAFVLLLGTNPVISNRGLRPTEVFNEIHGDPQRTLVVVDPRQTETAKKADRHLAIRPGTDVALLLSLAATIVAEGLHDAAFVRSHTVGFEGLAAALAEVDVDELCARAELDPAQVREVARGFAKAPSATVFWDLGVEQAPYSTLLSYLMRVLLVITGNLCRPGGAYFLSTFLTDPSVRSRPAPLAPQSGIAGLPMFGQTGYFSPNLLAEEIEAEHPERIRAVIVEGSNPLVQYADANRVERALDKLDLLVVIEPSMSETAQMADYVLPTPTGYEKWEWAMFPKGYPEIYAQLRPPAVPRVGEGLPEPELYHRLALAMGVVQRAPAALRQLVKVASPRKLGPAFLGAVTTWANKTGRRADTLFWIYELVGPHLEHPSLVGPWGACHMFARGREADVHRSLGDARKGFALGEHMYDLLLAHPEGVELARVDPAADLKTNVRHPDGRIRLAVAPMLHEIQRALGDALRPPAAYPWVLQAGRRTRWNANSIQRDPKWRKGRGPHCPLFVHPDDAAKIGVGDGARVRVHSPAGEVFVPLSIDDSMRPGHVAIPNGFGTRYPDDSGELQDVGVNVNRLTSALARDPFTGVPHHKFVTVQIEPA